MSNLSKCPSCAGVVPSRATVCPHCVEPMPKKTGLGKLAIGVLGGIGASMTLMACYGAPPACRSLPDGGDDCSYQPVSQDAGNTTDGGVTTDGGTTTDGGVSMDGGADGGP